jgi:hypothetical protein
MREGALPEALEHRLEWDDLPSELPVRPAPQRRVPYPK